MLPRQRIRQFPITHWFAGQDLKDRHPAALEGVRRAGHVDLPDAVFFFADDFFCGIAVRFQSFHPMPQRARIVRAQAFCIPAFQAVGGERFDDLRYVHQFAAGKYILFDEFADVAAQAFGVEATGSDAVIQHQPAGF